MIAVNVTVLMGLMRAARPMMIETIRGAIVDIASEAACAGSAGGFAYTTSK